MEVMLRIKFSLLFFFCLSCPTPIEAQIVVDSLKQIWTNQNEVDSLRFKAINQYYINNTEGQPDSSLQLIEYHYRLAQEKNSLKEMANATNEKALVFFIKGELDIAMASLNETKDILLEMKDTLRVGSIYNNMGALYMEQSKYQNAIQHYSKALDLFQAKKLGKEKTAILNNLGLVYYYIDDYELALEYFHKALEDYTTLNLIHETGKTWMHIASANSKLKDYDKALINARKGIKISEKYNDRFGATDSYFVIAESFQKLNQLDSAFHYVEKSLVFTEAINNENKTLERLVLKANLTSEKNIALATKDAEDILKRVKETTPYRIKKGLYQLLYKCYKTKGETDLSLKMLEKSNLYSDSVAIEKNKNAVIREAVQKDFEIKLSENQLENKKERDKLKESQLKKILGIGLFAGLSILGILLYSRNNNKKNQLEREALLNELEELKNRKHSDLVVPTPKFELHREKIESSIHRKINETDWNVLNILLDDPVITNKEIAKKANMSVDGIGSSLIRMYTYFDIKNSKYKKISLLMDAIKLSNKDN